MAATAATVLMANPAGVVRKAKTARLVSKARKATKAIPANPAKKATKAIPVKMESRQSLSQSGSM